MQDQAPDGLADMPGHNGTLDLEQEKNVILPSLEWVINEVGVKPLIVPIDPIDTENDNYWYYYSSSAKLFIKDKLKKHV